jgi:ubiquinone biosynthesis monooxygenase Coq7
MQIAPFVVLDNERRPGLSSKKLPAFGDGMTLQESKQLSIAEALTIARIVRVNHAGEFGAIRIYSAQISVASKLYLEIVPALATMLGHEKIHCAKFLAAMPERNARPCRVMSFWSWGGWWLGLFTALMGRQAIWICTAAVEAAVHRHLDDQLHFLDGRDRGLAAIILSIREEEMAHLQHAEDHIEARGAGGRMLHRLITVATDAVIWLSTWGDSTRMARALQSSRPSV